MENLTYQQMRLMEQVATAAREQYTYLIAPIEAEDASACVSAGLLNVFGDGSLKLTEAGHAYIIDINTITP